MKKKQWIILSLFSLCILFAGCGKQTQKEQKGDDTASMQEYTQEDYQKLAEENVKLSKQYRDLSSREKSYENKYVSDSAKRFEEPDLMAETLKGIQGAVEEPESFEEVTENNVEESEKYVVDDSIPQIEDEQLETAILQLTKENKILAGKIKILEDQMKVYSQN